VVVEEFEDGGVFTGSPGHIDMLEAFPNIYSTNTFQNNLKALDVDLLLFCMDSPYDSTFERENLFSSQMIMTSNLTLCKHLISPKVLRTCTLNQVFAIQPIINPLDPECLDVPVLSTKNFMRGQMEAEIDDDTNLVVFRGESQKLLNYMFEKK
jgi:hypothetical protein